MQRGRERKAQSNKNGGLRHRKQAGEAFEDIADTAGWSSALDPQLLHGASKHSRKQKKSGRNQAEERPVDEVYLAAARTESNGNAGCDQENQAPEKRLSARTAQADSLFVSWEELLESREALKRRVDAIAAVHGWEGASARQSFLGGVEPSALLPSIKAEIAALAPAGEVLEAAGLVLELQGVQGQLHAAGEERDRLAESLLQLQEECFEVRNQLAGQSNELETLRQLAAAATLAHAAAASSEDAEGGGEGRASAEAEEEVGGAGSGADALRAFKVTLSRREAEEGRRVVRALERLKVPDESVMGPRELACWHENKKTIMNSLKTLSSQIYSATTRILYEIIQNADDCTFESDGDFADGEARAVRELWLECSDEALVAFHNEKGFQPKDLYAMCQVGESSKPAGSGKIGRKGIGFKSVFQICDCPLVVSPPFQFCFDTLRHGVFGYIVPTWVDSPAELVPPLHRPLLSRIFGPSGPASTGTLLVCPIAPRVRGLDLMRDLSFDGLSLAFLKNLEQVSFVSSTSRGPAHEDPGTPASAAQGKSRVWVHRVERTEEDVDSLQGVAEVVLKGIRLVSHKLSRCTIIQRENESETRRHYRLHSYTILKYKAAEESGAGDEQAATTTISLAFPVDDALTPVRSADGELIFAYLPVTAAGFGFAINADFELVASRQDVSDSHSSNHVLLGRIPALFVHAILTDPALGEEAFAAYLPDLDSLRRDRSGGWRNWHALATALHRQTGAWMTIPTEDAPERVPRRQVVLRPSHLSQALVPNSLLRAVTRSLEGGELNFAHADAVVEMALEACVDPCPVSVVLLCLQAILEPPQPESGAGSAAGDSWQGKQQGRRLRGKKGDAWAGDGEGAAGEPARAAIGDDALRDIWRYLAAECAACSQQGAAGRSASRALVDALIGPPPRDPLPGAPPLRVFPVRGCGRLRLHSEYGVPLCSGLAPSLSAQGPGVRRLAGRVLPRVDSERLAGVAGLGETLRFLRVGDASEEELELQLRNCFRFGVAATADPQLWWDAFRYLQRRGHRHGLADFMPGAAIALPLAGSAPPVASSRDVQRLSLALPSLLGLRRKPSTGAKHLLALPPSASTWCARVRWELALVQAFGVTYPRSDLERVPAAAFVTDLVYAVAEAREGARGGTLKAFGELLDLYNRRLGSLLPFLRSAAQASHRPQECLLERRAEPRPYASSCSPKYVEEVLRFCGVTLSDDSFHGIRELLESTLGMLQLKPVHEGKQEDGAATGNEGTCDADSVEGDSDENSQGGNFTSEVTDEDEEDEDEDEDDEDACEEATWAVLERMLGFHHAFKPRDCPWLLYSVLTPALVEEKEHSAWDTPHVRTLKPMAADMAPLLIALEVGTIMGCSESSEGCGLDVAADLWPLICNAGGIWLGGDFVTLERCVWKSGGGEIWRRVSEYGCQAGGVVAIESMLVRRMEEAHEVHDAMQGGGRTAFLAAMGRCCSKGAATSQGPASMSPGLPHSTELEMMLDSTLPMLLQRDLDALGEAALERGFEHRWSQALVSCYAATIAALADGFPSGRRWAIPVPSASLGACQVLVDRGLNRQLARDQAALVVLPDAGGAPRATEFALRHVADACLHPAVAPLFAPVAERQSVGLEAPCALLRRTFRSSLRLAAAPEQRLDALWELIGEVYHRPLAAQASVGESERQATMPAGLTDGDHWDLLLWAAITCAKQWFRMRGSIDPQLASSYQETLQRVRRLVPFIAGGGRGEGWGFLCDREGAGGVLLLRTLFGLHLWGNLAGLQLLEHAPAYTADIPANILRTCSGAARLEDGGAGGSFPEHLERGALVLVWEWFLLEVAGAAPPAVLWSTIQEPVAAWARPRIREAEAALRGQAQPLVRSLLEAVCAQTRIGVLMEEMDAADEARAAEAAREAALRRREAEAREREREAAEARLLAEAEALRRQRDQERHARESEEATRPRRHQHHQQQQQQHQQHQHQHQQHQHQHQHQQHQHQHQHQQHQHQQQRPGASAPPHSPPPPTHSPPGQPRFLPAAGAAGPESTRLMEEIQGVLRAQHDELHAARGLPQRAAQGQGGGGGGIAFMLGLAGGAGAAGGGAPAVRREVQGQTMRVSEVKGKLARFLAGMRAYERQQSAAGCQEGGGQQRLPPALSEFIAWAGDTLAGQRPPGGGGGGGHEQRNRRAGAGGVEEAARRYMGRGGGSAEAAEEGSEGDLCCICLEVLRDPAVHATLGEPLITACGHRFHAVCYAKAMESRDDPWCPVCRSDNFGSTRFLDSCGGAFFE